MRRALIIVGALILVGALVTSAFAGGIVVGRISGRAASPTVETTAPEPLRGDDAEQVPDALPPTLEGEATEPPPTDTPAEEPSPTNEPQASEETTDLPPTEAFDYELLETVLELLDDQYYGDIPNGDELAYGAIRGMLMTLGDPYTSFIEPSISAILNEDASGEFEGIGAMVSMREDGYLEIASLIPGQPAEAAGVLPGDIIVAVNGEDIVGLGLYEAISYIRGPANTEAELEIIRPTEPDRVFITVTRARIEIPIIESEIIDNDIAYVRLTEFDANATERVEEALDELFAQNPRALIFDLRDNPGGWLNQAIGVADLFLEDGIVAIQRDSEGREQRFPSETGQIGEDIPMVVLVNAGSASASEIVAGAIQDRGRGILIGMQTLGKGSVQLPNNLDDGSQLRVTIARWYTPNEQPLHGTGLTPDVEAPYPVDTPAGEDPQLQRALEYLNEGAHAE